MRLELSWTTLMVILKWRRPNQMSLPRIILLCILLRKSHTFTSLSKRWLKRIDSHEVWLISKVATTMHRSLHLSRMSKPKSLRQQIWTSRCRFTKMGALNEVKSNIGIATRLNPRVAKFKNCAELFTAKRIWARQEQMQHNLLVSSVKSKKSSYQYAMLKT